MNETDTREKKTWWILPDGSAPTQKEGYSCAPQNPDYWWFPGPGFSTSRVYATEQEAMIVALEEESRAITSAMARLNKLKVRAEQLGMYGAETGMTQC